MKNSNSLKIEGIELNKSSYPSFNYLSNLKVVVKVT